MNKFFFCILLTIFMCTAEANSAVSQVSAMDQNTATKKKHYDFMHGYASYYGGKDGFDGRLMANGDVFDSNDLHLAAHPTLPIGTKLKVTDLSNSKTLYVEVTDRMPVHKGRVIDLTRHGAIFLGMKKRGIQKVKLAKISDAEFAQAIAPNDNS